MTSQLSAKFTLWVNRIIAAALPVLALCMPRVMDFYGQLRPLSEKSRLAVLLGFYCCLPVVLAALFLIERLVSNILKEQVFIPDNVRCIRFLRWCCAGVSLICLPASVFYPPLIFMVVIMAFLALVVSVVKNVMAAAVELREENDLTI